MNLMYNGNNMAIEIELKAHVEDRATLRSKLAETAEFLGSFEKDDTMWYSSDPLLLNPYGVRIRREKNALPNGTTESRVFVTQKNKEVKAGIEVNQEEEFEICSSSGQPAQAFENLLRRMGLTPGAGKRKRGEAFILNGIRAELLEVEGLGRFIELEILAEPSRADVNMEKKRLLDLLDSLGIKRDAIESRSYLQMLKQ